MLFLKKCFKQFNGNGLHNKIAVIFGNSLPAAFFFPRRAADIGKKGIVKPERRYHRQEPI
jgi:hypothetical protein